MFSALAAGTLLSGCDAPVDVLEPKIDAASYPSIDAAVDAPNDVTRDGWIEGSLDSGADASSVPEEWLAEARPFAAAHCEWMRTCTPGLFASFYLHGDSHCVESLTVQLAQVRATGHTAPIAQWCIHSLATDPDCDTLQPDCVPPPGTVAEGEACASAMECARTDEGAPMSCRECRCEPLPDEGEPCDGDVCDDGLVCRVDLETEASTCRAATFVGEGETCDPTVLLLCEAGAWCVDGTCLRRPRRGEVCEPDGPPCLLLFYDVPYPDPSVACVRGGDDVHRCGDPWEGLVRGAGEPCARGESCGGGQACPSSGICPSTCGGGTSCAAGEGCVEGACVVAPLYCSAR